MCDGVPPETAVVVTGHAGLDVRTGTTSLLVDPWLGGSAYWRSWWQYPPPLQADAAMLAPSYVMLSHHHFDHFHFPSMRRIDRAAHLLIPEFAVDVMPSELGNLGFTTVTELVHGRRYPLEDGLVVAAYQYGLDDSVLVIASGSTVIYDVNDCKIRGRALDAVLEEFGPPTFLLKNYSAAQAYPHCYRAEDPDDLGLLSGESYITDFLDTVRATRPRFAVPFASMVCFLHPETMAFNANVVTPDRVADAFAADPVVGTELVVLAPGDRWNDRDGFEIGATDWYGERDVRIAALADEAEERIAAALVEEGDRTCTFAAFAAYLGDFVGSLPWFVRRMFARAVCFSSDDRIWAIDIRHGAVVDLATPPEGWATVVEVPPGVLADAIEKRILNLVHISMRLRIELAPGGVSTDFMFWALLIIFELGYFPLSGLDRRRVARVAWSRRREFLDMAVVAARTRGSLAQRLSASFMATA